MLIQYNSANIALTPRKGTGNTNQPNGSTIRSIKCSQFFVKYIFPKVTSKKKTGHYSSLNSSRSFNQSKLNTYKLCLINQISIFKADIAESHHHNSLQTVQLTCCLMLWTLASKHRESWQLPRANSVVM